MAKTKLAKKETLKDLEEKVAKTKLLVFTGFFGLTVKDVEDLRKRCRKEDVELLVVKKTLLKLAMEKAGIKDIPDLSGEIAVALGYGDEVAAAKILHRFAKDHEALKLVGGVLEGKYLDLANIKQLAQLPSKQELLGKLVGAIQAPVSGFVNVLAGNLRGLVGVLAAIGRKSHE